MEQTLITRNIALDANDWKQLGRQAIDQGTSRSKLVRQAVASYLSTTPKNQKK